MTIARNKISMACSPLISSAGSGYLAGELPAGPLPDDPDGRAKILNVPARVRVDAFERSTMRCVGRAISKPDGTWRIPYLALDNVYVVAGFDDYGAVNAAIQDWIVPVESEGGERPFQVRGDIPERPVAGLATTWKLRAFYVTGTVTFTVSAGALPAGMTSELLGTTLVISGAPAAGPFSFDITAEDDSGAPVILSFSGTTIVGYAHWRLYFSSAEAGGQVAVNELEMRGVAGGTDLCVGGSATSSSNEGSTSAARAFDGSMDYLTGCWVSFNGAMPQWLAYAFPEPVAIAEFAIWPQNHVLYATRGPKDFVLQYSVDGISGWITAATYTGITGWVPGDGKTFSV
jgi:hypothetical protein